MRKLAILIPVALGVLTVSGATEMTVFVGENAGDAVVVPEPSGYAVVYRDFAPDPVVRFARYDAAGNRTDGPVDLVDSRPSQIDLRPTDSGYLFFARFGLSEIRTLPLSGSGNPTGPWQVAAVSSDLHQFGVAAGSRGEFVLVWPAATNLVFDVYARAVGADGTPSAEIHTLSSGLLQPFPIFEAGAFAGKKGPSASWLVSLGDLTIRDLHGDGRPKRNPILFQGGRVYDAEFAAAGFLEAGLFSVDGPGGRDLMMRVRSKGKLQDPVSLAREAYDEGSSPCTTNAIRVAASPDRIGVAYGTRLDVVGPCIGVWFFAEFDLDGNRIGPLRNLRSEGKDLIAARLAPDEHRNQYVLSWVGTGPDGDGGYFMTVDRSP